MTAAPMTCLFNDAADAAADRGTSRESICSRESVTRRAGACGGDSSATTHVPAPPGRWDGVRILGRPFDNVIFFRGRLLVFLWGGKVNTCLWSGRGGGALKNTALLIGRREINVAGDPPHVTETKSTTMLFRTL